MKKSGLSLVAVAMFAFGGVASAADLEAVPYQRAPVPVAPVYDWTGFYVGADLGARWTDARWTTTCQEPGFAVGCTPFPARFNSNNPLSFNSASVKGGVYGGYNWQFAPSWVVGLEGDFQWGDNKLSRNGIAGLEDPAVAGSPGLDRSSIRQTWDASLRGRFGVLVSTVLLVYGTGGVSFTHVEANAFCGSAFAVGWCANPANLGTSQTASSNRVGWTVGGGLEAKIAAQWLLRGEYRYADYGKFNSTLFSGVDGFSFDTRIRNHTATLGIAYKFGGPVVARY